MDLCRCLLRGLLALLLLQLAFACALAPASSSLPGDTGEVLWRGTWLRSALISAGTLCPACVLNCARPHPQSLWVFDSTLQLLLGCCLSWDLAQQPKQRAPRRRDYYDILKVPKGAADSVIKRSYRKLALQYHPVRPPFLTLGLPLGVWAAALLKGAPACVADCSGLCLPGRTR